MVKPVKLAVVADTSQLRGGLLKAEAQLQGFGANMKKLGAQLGGAFVFGAAIKASFDELLEAEKVAAQTTAAIKSTGGAAKVSADSVADLASELSKKSGIDDELIQTGSNLLLTFTNIRNEVGEGNDVFDRATEAALDLSVAGFGSVESTSKTLGKALQDPITGMTALKRAGVQLTEAQKDTIRALVESGDMLGAQKIILEEVERQVGGSAKAYGETLPGQLGKAKNALEETGAAILSSLAPAIGFAAEQVQSLAGVFAALPEPIRNATVAYALFAAARRTDSYATLVGTLKSLPRLLDGVGARALYAKDSFDKLAGSTGGLKGLAAATGPLALFVGAAVVGFLEVRKAAERMERNVRQAIEGMVPEDKIEYIDDQLGDIQDRIDNFGIDFQPFAWMDDANDKTLAARDSLEGLRTEQLLVNEVVGAWREATGGAADGTLGLAEAQRQAAEATENHADAMKEVNDALQAQFDPLFAVQDALLDNRDAQADVAAATEDLAVAQERYMRALSSGDPGEVASASQELAAAQEKVDAANRDATRSALDVQTALNTLTGKVRDGEISLEDSAATLEAWVAAGLITEAQAIQTRDAFALLFGSVPPEVSTEFKWFGIPQVTGELGALYPVIEDTTDGISDTADAFEEATDKARDYFDLLNGNLGNAIQWEEAWDDLEASIRENGTTLDITSEAGRDNVNNLRDLAQAALDSAFAYREQTGDLDGAKAQLYANRDALVEHFTALGLDEQAVYDLIAQMGLTPDQIETQFSQPGLAEANTELGIMQGYLQWLKDNPVIQVDAGVRITASEAGDELALLTFLANLQGGIAAAEGGQLTANTVNLVGEEGPELFVPNVSGTIVPAEPTRAYLAGMKDATPRADGGPVAAGTNYMVGENGPELYVPNGTNVSNISSTVAPNVSNTTLSNVSEAVTSNAFSTVAPNVSEAITSNVSEAVTSNAFSTVMMTPTGQPAGMDVTQGFVTENQANKTNIGGNVVNMLTSAKQGIVNVYKAFVGEARAEGGPVGAGTDYLVGENGPELFIPNVSGTIVPTEPTMAYLAGVEGATPRADGGPVLQGRPYLVGEEGPELFVSKAPGAADQPGGMTIGAINFNVPASEEVAAHTVRKMRQMTYLLGSA